MRRLWLAFVAISLCASPAYATVADATMSTTIAGTGQTVFSVPYPFLAADHLTVTKITIATSAEATLTRGVDYSVTLPLGSTLGYVTTSVAVTSSYRIRIDRVVPVTQTTSFRTQGAFLPSTHEAAFDKLTMIAQQIKAAAGTDGTTAVNTHVGLADPHTQYALLAGRAGGQNLRGGTAASENLQMSSTFNATKGKVILGANGTELVVDEVNHRVGIGTATPSVTLDVLGDVKLSDNAANALHVFGGHLFKTLDTGSLSLCSGKSTTVPCGGQIVMTGPTYAVTPYYVDVFGDTIVFADASLGGVARMTLNATTLTLAAGIKIIVDQTGNVQTPQIYGGTGVGGNLKLSTTTNGTKGKLYLNSALTSAFDEANNRLGIGTSAPATTLDVVGAGQFTSTVTSLKKTTAFGATAAAVSPTDCDGYFSTSTNNAVLTLPAGVAGCVITLQNSSSGHGAKVSMAPQAGESIIGSCVGGAAGTGAAGTATLSIFTGTVAKQAQNPSATENKGDYLTVLGTAGGWISIGCMGIWQSEP